ncbi:sigma-70 family RNA polymerase sigma factor [Bacillus sp. 03113]|uniref:sigma-70 family RNA polymerase sigma factor n=1 Tax=Bacillus sp. 03113 TaxID=2578211 RepID=UPI001142AF3F|nr:sigma-70 family RNA polymerase sigma factor [Bacillus sp. 03113]
MIEKARVFTEEICDEMNHEEILRWLMEEYGNDIIQIAYTFLKNKQLAEDVAQDVFLKAFQHLDNFRKGSSYKTWLIRITVNRCKDVRKSWAYKNLVFTEYLPFKKVQASHENENEFISQKVLDLPLKEREAIILYYYESFKIEEISDLLKVNINTIKTRLHRGRMKLKKALEEGGTYGE